MKRFAIHGRWKDDTMSWLWMIAAFAAWIALMKWVLPRFGVGT